MDLLVDPMRVRHIQQLVQELSLDGMLITTGLDSQYSVGSAQVAGFAFMGRSNRAVVEAAQAPEQHILDDLVLFVARGHVSVYVPTEEAAATLRQALHGQLPQIFQPTPAEADNPDLCDDVKLAAMVQMLRGVKKLGLPLGVPKEGEAPPIQNGHSATAVRVEGSMLMQLEKWPLLQAYGMDGVGRDGFFTQCFEIYDVYDALQTVYGTLDSMAVRDVIQDQLTQLKKHWTEVIKGVTAQPPTAQASLTERQVLEPLQGFFQYGMVRAVPGVNQVVTMPPRAVFGRRTNDETTTADAATLTSASAGCGSAATHLVLEAADPRSPLRVARTYFMSTAGIQKDVFADPQDEVQEGFSYATVTGGWDPCPTVTLMRVYSALCQAARAAMEHFAAKEGATVQTMRSVALEVLSSRCTALGVPQPALSSQLRMDVWQCDHANRVDRVAVRGSGQLKVLRMALLDVHCVDPGGRTGALLGGVVYADTFLEVPGAPSGLLVLTSDVPSMVCWPAVGCEAVLQQRAAQSFRAMLEAVAAGKTGASVTALKAQQRAREQQRALRTLTKTKNASRGGAGGEGDDVQDEDEDKDQEEDQELQVAAYWPDHTQALGKLLTLGGGDDVVLLTGCPTQPCETGSLYCFARGLVFISHNTKALWALDFVEELEAVTIQPLNHPRATTTTTSSGGGAVASSVSAGEAVVLRGKHAACGFPPASQLTTNSCIAVSLASMTPAVRRHIMSVVLPAWQQTCREGAVAAQGPDWTGPSEPISYSKDPSASNPFPEACFAAQLAAVQRMHEGGKTWPDLAESDDYIETVVKAIDDAEWRQLGGNYPAVERLLCGGVDADGTWRRVAGSVPVTLVVGLPGCDQASVAHAVLEMVGDESAPRAAWVTGGVDAGLVTPTDLAAALDSCLSSSITGHVVLVTESFTPLVEQLSMLAACAVVTSGRCHLGSVVSCVSPVTLWELRDRQSLAPGLAGQLPAGFLDAVVVAANNLNDFKQAQSVLLSLPVSSTTPIVRGGSLAMLMKARDDLLPPPQERASRLLSQAPQRQVAYWPPSRQSSTPTAQGVCRPGPLRGALQVVKLSFVGELDTAKFSTLLAQLQPSPSATHGATETPATAPFPLKEAPPAPATTTCWQPAPEQEPTADALLRAQAVPTLVSAARAAGCSVLGASGTVRVALGAFPVDLVWGGVSSGSGAVGGAGELRTHTCVMQDLPIYHGRPRFLDSDVSCGGEVVVWGTTLPEVQAWAALLQSCSQLPTALTAVGTDQAVDASATPVALNPLEVAAVAEEHRFDPLPEGFSYDGCRYYDAFGDSSPNHPDLEQFVQCKQRERQEAAVRDRQARQAAAAEALSRAVRVTSVTKTTVSS